MGTSGKGKMQIPMLSSKQGVMFSSKSDYVLKALQIRREPTGYWMRLPLRSAATSALPPRHSSFGSFGCIPIIPPPSPAATAMWYSPRRLNTQTSRWRKSRCISPITSSCYRASISLWREGCPNGSPLRIKPKGAFVVYSPY
jgi:hypothetical protein